MLDFRWPPSSATPNFHSMNPTGWRLRFLCCDIIGSERDRDGDNDCEKDCGDDKVGTGSCEVVARVGERRRGSVLERVSA